MLARWMACGDAMTFQTDGGRESLVEREGRFQANDGCVPWSGAKSLLRVMR
jgi:hypothetical protein